MPKGDAMPLRSYLIRDIPDYLYRDIKIEAAVAGVTMKTFLMSTIEAEIQKRRAQRQYLEQNSRKIT